MKSVPLLESHLGVDASRLHLSVILLVVISFYSESRRTKSCERNSHAAPRTK
jgi:hypothetical protein